MDDLGVIIQTEGKKILVDDISLVEILAKMVDYYNTLKGRMDQLTSLFDDLSNKTDEEIKAIITDVTTKYNDILQAYNNFKINITNELTEFKTSTTSNYNNFTEQQKTDYNNFVTTSTNAYETMFNDLTESYNNFVTSVNNNLSEFQATTNQNFENYKTSTNESITEKNNSVDSALADLNIQQETQDVITVMINNNSFDPLFNNRYGYIFSLAYVGDTRPISGTPFALAYLTTNNTLYQYNRNWEAITLTTNQNLFVNNGNIYCVVFDNTANKNILKKITEVA